jgi:small subunit ribosomal protein S13
MKMGDLPEDKVKQLEQLVSGYADLVPTWALNRQSDYETGNDLHLIGQDIELMVKDDVNRMKMIRCYRGVRHEARHKVRGQRTRSNGRKGLTMGVSRRRGA